MPLQITSLQTVGAYQQRLMNLDAGCELRCLNGTLQLRFIETGSVFSLLPGQVIRVADPQVVAVESTEPSQFWLQQQGAPALIDRTQKNRQGLAALAARLWRSFSTAA